MAMNNPWLFTFAVNKHNLGLTKGSQNKTIYKIVKLRNECVLCVIYEAPDSICLRV